jgi:DNA-binding HxlR family transcriptional regulator
MENKGLTRDRKNKDFNPNNCPVTHCMNKIGGKWKPIVIFLINMGKNRFSLLQKAIPDISKQMLVNQLREMEEDNLIERTIYAEIPPRVEYRLSEYGKTVLPIIGIMADWGKTDMNLS